MQMNLKPPNGCLMGQNIYELRNRFFLHTSYYGDEIKEKHL
jgi:hypothetical protein